MNFFTMIEKKNNKNIVKYEEDILEFERVDKLVKVKYDAKGTVDEDEFEVKEVVVPKTKINRQEYINSFREDVGIANILKKVALSGDVSLLNQVKRTNLPLSNDGKEIVQDVTALQAGDEAIAKMGDNMRKTFNNLPDELKAGRSLESFLEGVTQAEIDAFVADYIKRKQGGINDVK